jgi:hypothetical protein
LDVTHAPKVEIGTLAISGFSARDGQRVEAGFRDELARLTLEVTQAPDVEICLPDVRDNTPERIGAAAARALIAGLAP